MDLVTTLSVLGRYEKAEWYLDDQIRTLSGSTRVGDGIHQLQLATKKAELALLQQNQDLAARRWTEIHALSQQAAGSVGQRCPLCRMAAPLRRRHDACRLRTGEIYFQRGQFADARRHWRRGLGDHEKLAQPSDLKVQLLANLASLDRAEGRWKSARQYGQDAATICERLIADTQETAGRRNDLMPLQFQLQRVYQQLGRYRDAIRINRGLSLQQQQLGDNAPQTYFTCSNLGVRFMLQLANTNRHKNSSSNRETIGETAILHNRC